MDYCIQNLYYLNQFYLEKDSLKLFKSLEKNKMAFSNYSKAKSHIIKNWVNIDSIK